MKRFWTKYSLWTCVVSFAFASLLTACGQKGKLYLPGDPKYAKETKKYERYRKMEEEDKKKNQEQKK